LNPERWAQIEELFHRVAECEPKQRVGLLNEACSNDPELRREVEGLLSCDGKAGNHIQAAVRSELSAVGFPLSGKTVSHYRILDGVGGGGMGVVYRAEDIKLGRMVALKFLPEDSARDPFALGRFEREARAASALEHPNICPIYEFGEHEGQPFLVMQLLEGQTLAELISATAHGKPALDLDKLLNLAIQITEGLDAAHRQGIIHRDIKPANIFVTSQGQAKILDFGLVKLTRAQTAGNDSERALGGGDDVERLPPEIMPEAGCESFLSRTGVAMGTVGYMSPEQVRGEKLDARTDLFSLGSVLYEMATGRRAFTGDTGPVRQAILNQTPSPARQLNVELPAKLVKIINRALQKDQEARYCAASEMRTDLQALKRETESRRLPSWATLSGAAVVLVASLGAGGYFVFRSPVTRITEKDSVVMADFKNTTNDAVFDEALKQALAVELEQSPFLNVVSDRRVGETLRMMGRPADERVTVEVGREICLRTGSKALLGGAISSLGSHYLIDVNAVACTNGDTLAREQVEATDKEDVLKALNRATFSLRSKLGESLPSVQKFDVPIEATTTSLEALKNYSLGIKVSREHGSAPSIPFFKRAIELDPGFPMAYVGLARSYGNLNQPSLSFDNAAAAYKLRDLATEREKLRISANYFAATGELEKEAQTYDLWIASYPGDPVPHRDLGAIYSVMGQYDKVLGECKEASRLEPDNISNYANLGQTYFSLNRLEDAEATFDQALARKLDGGSLRWMMYYLAFLRGDSAQMEEQVAWGEGKPGVEDTLFSFQSDTEAYYGRLTRARDFSRKAADSAIRSESKEGAALWQLNAALREVEFGETGAAKQRLTDALALATSRDTKILAAMVFARIGEPKRAKKLVEELGRNYPSATALKLYWFPSVKAAIELSEGNSSQALVLLETATPYELGSPEPLQQLGTLYPAYLRGQAQIMARNPRAGAVEFQKLLDHPGIVLNFSLGALARLQLARAYAMAGDTPKATSAYRDFLLLWKDADRDIPVLEQARAEYAKLL
jgi:eukaryotic-like serine/threonine-protein kinase